LEGRSGPFLVRFGEQERGVGQQFTDGWITMKIHAQFVTESAVLGEPRVGSSGESRPLPARNFVIA